LKTYCHEYIHRILSYEKSETEKVEEIGFNPYLAIESDKGISRLEELLKMIQELPEGYRMIFNMYAIDGYTHGEIAQPN
jgi:DNA-directed RNA polymerase specialized sigma24 family protein